MNVDGARIYDEGVGIGRDYEGKIRQIVDAVKSLSPSSDVSMRFLRSGHTYEGLLWGTANNIPIGAYNRGPTMSHVLDSLYRRVKKECLKVWKLEGLAKRPKGKSHSNSRSSVAMAG